MVISPYAANVGSVEHISPLRYPGGKTWFVPSALEIVRALPRARVFLEPFAGGASVGLAVAANGLADRVVLADADPDISALWRVLCGPRSWSESLCEKILHFEMTRENVLRLREENPKDDQSVAFRTLVLNRTSRGGNIYTGSLVRSGESGRGISSRWYPDTLVFRIRRINHLASSGVLTFQQCDVFPMLSSYDFSDTVLFLDPPYTSEGTSAGHRLYAHAALDHAHLLQKFATFSGAAFATHENTHTILELARCHGLLVREVEMKTTHHLKKKEIVLFNRALGKQIA